MRTIIELDEEDIRQVIANSFDVDKSKVKIEYHKECEGYGSMEHEVVKVGAEVEKNENS